MGGFLLWTASITMFFCATALGQSLPYRSSDFGCISENQAKKYIRDLNINTKSFGGLELCHNHVDTKKLFNDLYIVENGKFEEAENPIDHLFIKNFVNKDRYYSWLKDMTYGIRRGQDNPIATAYNIGGYFTMQDAWSALSALGRVGVLLHEARHTEGYGHIQCKHGPYSDIRIQGCDQSVESRGSHSVEMEYYARVALQGQNFHPVYMSMARIMSVARANFVFNTGPMSIREGLLTLTAKPNKNSKVQVEDLFGDEIPGNEILGELQLLDQGRSIASSVVAPKGYMLKRTSAGATLFYGNGNRRGGENQAKNQALTIDIYSPLKNLYRDNYSYYKVLYLHSERSFKDFEELDEGLKRYLVGLTNEGKIYVFNFRRGQWFRPTIIQKADFLSPLSPKGERGLFVIKSNHSMCQYDLQRRRCQDMSIQWPSHIQSYALYEERLIELHKDGKAYNSLDRTPFQEAPSVGQFVNIPLYDAYGTK